MEEMVRALCLGGERKSRFTSKVTDMHVLQDT
jgi:hypothetical protein